MDDLKIIDMLDVIDDLDIIEDEVLNDDTDHENEVINDIVQFEEPVAPRRRLTYRKLPNHFHIWKKNNFLQRFRLNIETVKYVLIHIKSTITPETRR